MNWDMDGTGSKPESHSRSIGDRLRSLENEFLFQNSFTDFRQTEIMYELDTYRQVIEDQSTSLYKSTVLEDIKRRIQILREAVKKVDTVKISEEDLKEIIRKNLFGTSKSSSGEQSKRDPVSDTIHSLQRRFKNVHENLNENIIVSNTEDTGSKKFLKELSTIKDLLLILREEIRCVVPMTATEEAAVDELKKNCDDDLEKMDLNIRKVNFENYVFSVRKSLSDPCNINESSLGKLKVYVEKLDPFDDQTYTFKLRLLDDINEHIYRLKDPEYKISVETNVIFNNINTMVPEESQIYFDTASKIIAVMEDIHSTQYSKDCDLFQTQTDALHWMHKHVKNLNLWGQNVCTVHQIKEAVEYLDDLLQDFNVPFAEIFVQSLKTKISQIKSRRLPESLKRQLDELLWRFEKTKRELPKLKIQHEKRMVRYTITLKEIEERLPLMESKVVGFKGTKLDDEYHLLTNTITNDVTELDEIDVYDGELNDRKEDLIMRLDKLNLIMQDKSEEFNVLSCLDRDIFNATELLTSAEKGFKVDLNKARDEFYKIGNKISKLKSTLDFKYFPDWIKSTAETYNIYKKEYTKVLKTSEDEEFRQEKDNDTEHIFTTDS